MVAKEFLARPDCGIDLVGFLDDNEHLAGLTVEGFPILGTTAELPRAAQKMNVSQVIITIASPSQTAIRRIVEMCDACKMPAKIIPPLHEIGPDQPRENP
jgi:FlaA1/EpsC-like NDP-sugar epimerase